MYRRIAVRSANAGLQKQAGYLSHLSIQLIFLSFLVPVFPAGAVTLHDPFGTEGDLPVQPTVLCRSVGEGAALDLITAVDVALCNNPQTRSAWAGAKASAAGLGQAQSAYLPTLNAGGDVTHNDIRGSGGVVHSAAGTYNSRTADLTLSYLLFDFGGREAAVESARQQMLSAGWNYSSVMQVLVFQVIAGYLNVFTAEESLDAARKSEDASKEAYDAAKAKEEVGVVTPADTAQAETAYSQSQLTRQQAENTLQLAQGSFAALLHLPPSSELKLIPVNPDNAAKPLDGKVEDMIRQALEHRPDLAALRAKERASEASFNLARTQDYPSLSLTGTDAHTDFSRSTAGSANDRTIGLTLSVPIFTGFSNTYQIESARHTMEAASADRTKAEDDVALDVWNSYHNYQTSLRTYTTAQVLLKSAEASEDLALGRYKEGKGTIIDTLTAQAALASARNQWVASRYNTLTTRFDLLRSLGNADWIKNIADTAPAADNAPPENAKPEEKATP